MCTLRWRWTGLVAMGCLIASAAGTPLQAQSCTTQAKMSAAERTAIGTTAYQLATAVQAGNAAAVRAAALPIYAADFNQTAALIESTAGQLRGDTLAVTQAYLLDAGSRPAGAGEADFACPLTGTLSEVDFAIQGLPTGRYAFVMVEARGTHPWLLSMLLEQEGSAWKLAGFYPHEREAAGHNGLWYWQTARADAHADKPWLAWLLYGEAAELLRPAPFMTSGNLDKLHNEQHTAAPEPLANGLGPGAPLTLRAADGASFRVSGLSAQGSEDGSSLRLILRLQPAGAGGPASPASGANDAARGTAAAVALLSAHPDLRQGFSSVWVFADAADGGRLLVEKPVGELAVVSR